MPLQGLRMQAPEKKGELGGNCMMTHFLLLHTMRKCCFELVQFHSIIGMLVGSVRVIQIAWG